MRHKKKIGFLLILIGIGVVLSIPEFFYENKGNSKSIGSVRNGGLENAYLLPFSGPNFRYFSFLSYYMFNNGYTHHKVHKTILDAYKECEQTSPNTFFRLMECSDKHGGKMLIHRTHQNGLSVDFMVPKLNGDAPSYFFDHFGMLHYLLDFDEKGQLYINKNVRLDFDAIGKHILAIDNAAQRNGLRIRKIILKIELKDDLYQTESGKEIQRRGIYIVRGLSDIVNRVHDDHYHIDFEHL